MGTSSAYGGPGGGTPLVPSWLGGGGGSGSQPSESGSGAIPGGPTTPVQPPIPSAGATTRFAAARNNFSRFAGSGGRDRASLGRAVSHYVKTASGGARIAAARMGASQGAGSRLLGLLSGAVSGGVRETLRALNLEHLAGQPIEQIFIGLADYVCPDGGTVDEGIAREAFIETIADLAHAGVTNFDGMTADQMQIVFELYATNAIEARLCNDIGAKTITLPNDTREVDLVQAQLHDFIRRGVADALTTARDTAQALTPDRILAFVGHIYEQAFGILQIIGNAEAEAS